MQEISNNRTDKIERSVIASILLEPRCFFEVSRILQPVMLSGWIGAIAYEVWDQMENNGEISLTSLAHDVEAKHQVSQSSVFSLVNFANPKTVIRDAQKIKEEYLRRNEIQIAEQMLLKLRKGNPVESTISDSQNERELLHDFSHDQNETRVKLVTDWFDKILSAKDGTKKPGFQTRFADLSERFGGFHPGDITIIAARPSMGKTTFLIDLLIDAATQGKPVLFYSLEMSWNHIVSIIAQKRTGISRKLMRSGNINDRQAEELQRFMEWFYELPIFIETGVFNIEDMKYKTRWYKRKYGIEILGIDYIQQMRTRDGKKSFNRNSELETISRYLVELVSEKDCNLHLFELAQLSRAVESRGGTKRPQMSDLRDSGSLEQDAANIIFPYRPEYYEIYEDANGDSVRGITELIIGKNRHVEDSLDSVKLKFNLPYNQFENEDFEPNEYVSPGNVIPLVPVNKLNDDDEIPF